MEVIGIPFMTNKKKISRFICVCTCVQCTKTCKIYKKKTSLKSFSVRPLWHSHFSQIHTQHHTKGTLTIYVITHFRKKIHHSHTIHISTHKKTTTTTKEQYVPTALACTHTHAHKHTKHWTISWTQFKYTISSMTWFVHKNLFFYF